MREEGEIHKRVAELLVIAPGVARDEVTPEARHLRDLGAESIDLLDITFRFERECGIKIARGELFLESIFEGHPDFVRDGSMTSAGAAELRSRMPYADFLGFNSDPRLDAVTDLFTVGLLDRFVVRKLERERMAADQAPARSIIPTTG